MKTKSSKASVTDKRRSRRAQAKPSRGAVTADPISGKVTLRGPLSVFAEYRAEQLGITVDQYVSELIVQQSALDASIKKQTADMKRELNELRASKSAIRFAEMSVALDAPGMAEMFLESILDQITRDDDEEVILGAYEWEKGRLWASGRLAAISAKWIAEDEAEDAARKAAKKIKEGAVR